MKTINQSGNCQKLKVTFSPGLTRQVQEPDRLLDTFISLQVLCPVIVITIFLFSGCTTPRIKIDGNTLTVRLDFTRQPENIHETGLISGVQILNLDDKDAIVGRIDKIIRYKDRIYLMDKSQTKSIAIYDTLGHFVNIISQYGRGPKEYIQLTDMFIDPVDTTFNIVSRVDKKILQYNLDGTRMTGVKKTPKAFTGLSKTGNGYVGYMGNYGEDREKPYNVWTMSPALKPEQTFFEIDKTWESINLGGGSVFSEYGDNINYITPMDCNIYTIGKEEITVPYSFDLGGTGWPADQREYEQAFQLRNGSHHYIQRFYYFQETSNHLIVQVLYEGQCLLGIYNKPQSKTHIARLEPYTDKYFFPFGQIVGFDEKAIYTLVDALDIKRMWDGKDQYNDFESVYPEQIRRLREKFEYVNEDGNPFLVIYSIN
jgi:hypothetical protein